MVRPPPFFLPLLAAVCSTRAEAARGPNPPRPDPFVDPAHDPYNPLRYITSNTLTTIAFGENITPVP